MARRSIAFIDPRRFVGWGDDIVSDMWNNTIGTMAMGNYGLNMYETAEEVVIELEAPGYKPENVDIEIEGPTLTVTGKVESSSQEADESKKYYHKEIVKQSFSRSVTLPAKVEADKAEASFDHGMIKIALPKMQEAKPHKIVVKKAA